MRYFVHTLFPAKKKKKLYVGNWKRQKNEQRFVFGTKERTEAPSTVSHPKKEKRKDMLCMHAYTQTRVLVQLYAQVLFCSCHTIPDPILFGRCSDDDDDMMT